MMKCCTVTMMHLSKQKLQVNDLELCYFIWLSIINGGQIRTTIKIATRTNRLGCYFVVPLISSFLANIHDKKGERA